MLCKPFRETSLLHFCCFSVVSQAYSLMVFDLSLPLGVAAGFPDVGLVVIRLWFPQHKAVVGLAIVGMVLIIVGYAFSVQEGIPWMAATNRILVIVGIWITAMLVVRHKKDDETPVQLLNRADETMYIVKSEEKNNFVFALGDIKGRSK